MHSSGMDFFFPWCPSHQFIWLPKNLCWEECRGSVQTEQKGVQLSATPFKEWSWVTKLITHQGSIKACTSLNLLNPARLVGTEKASRAVEMSVRSWTRKASTFQAGRPRSLPVSGQEKLAVLTADGGCPLGLKDCRCIPVCPARKPQLSCLITGW